MQFYLVTFPRNIFTFKYFDTKQKFDISSFNGMNIVFILIFRQLYNKENF